MAVNTRIYASGAITFGGQPAIDDLLGAGYSAVLVRSVHVDASGALFLNNTQIVKGGVYQEATPMNLPGRLAQLRKAGMQILFSVGSDGVADFQNIGNLLAQGGGVPGQPLYDNFVALKKAMVAGGGDIDAIDFDNEEIYQQQPNQPDPVQVTTMVGFGAMLARIGYASVTFCPYQDIETWTATYNQLRGKPNNVVVSAMHLQCYSGGRFNDPAPWGAMIANNGGGTLLIAGLATVQTPDGPWWNKGHPKPPVVPPSRGSSVVMTPNVAMYGQADWSGLLRKGNYPSPDAAMAAAIGGETFFFYCRGVLDLGPGKQFVPGDAVFFAGIPWWGSAPQCDAYSLSGPAGCTNLYNNNGACPSDLQAQYATWKAEKYPPDGGFIWLYDSTVNSLLSGCCGGTEKAPVTTAKAYREAITNGLS
jgi:hypothetical protein